MERFPSHLSVQPRSVRPATHLEAEELAHRDVQIADIRRRLFFRPTHRVLA
jgi:hypothetical protein